MGGSASAGGAAASGRAAASGVSPGSSQGSRPRPGGAARAAAGGLPAESAPPARPPAVHRRFASGSPAGPPRPPVRGRPEVRADITRAGRHTLGLGWLRHQFQVLGASSPLALEAFLRGRVCVRAWRRAVRWQVAKRVLSDSWGNDVDDAGFPPLSTTLPRDAGARRGQRRRRRRRRRPLRGCAAEAAGGRPGGRRRGCDGRRSGGSAGFDGRRPRSLAWLLTAGHVRLTAWRGRRRRGAMRWRQGAGRRARSASGRAARRRLGAVCGRLRPVRRVAAWCASSSTMTAGSRRRWRLSALRCLPSPRPWPPPSPPPPLLSPASPHCLAAPRADNQGLRRCRLTARHKKTPSLAVMPRPA